MIMVLCIASVTLLLLLVIMKIITIMMGDAKVVPQVEQRTPFIVVGQSKNSVTLSCTLPFVNEGRQCATLVDCLARTQLPYEQYDGIEAWGKVERADMPREDDYFEATLIEKHTLLALRVIVRLKARHGMDIETALQQMVDLPVDIIYTELSRRPWRLKKTRLVLTAEEILQAVQSY